MMRRSTAQQVHNVGGIPIYEAGFGKEDTMAAKKVELSANHSQNHSQVSGGSLLCWGRGLLVKSLGCWAESVSWHLRLPNLTQFTQTGFEQPSLRVSRIE
jgi:hypothetical protein